MESLAAPTTKDRALIAVFYESGCHIGKFTRLTWSRVRFDTYGAVVTVDDTVGREGVLSKGRGAKMIAVLAGNGERPGKWVVATAERCEEN